MCLFYNMYVVWMFLISVYLSIFLANLVFNYYLGKNFYKFKYVFHLIFILHFSFI